MSSLPASVLISSVGEALVESDSQKRGGTYGDGNLSGEFRAAVGMGLYLFLIAV